VKDIAGAIAMRLKSWKLPLHRLSTPNDAHLVERVSEQLRVLLEKRERKLDGLDTSDEDAMGDLPLASV
jgi:hypothetical protein